MSWIRELFKKEFKVRAKTVMLWIELCITSTHLSSCYHYWLLYTEIIFLLDFFSIFDLSMYFLNNLDLERKNPNLDNCPTSDNFVKNTNYVLHFTLLDSDFVSWNFVIFSVIEFVTIYIPLNWILNFIFCGYAIKWRFKQSYFIETFFC